MINYFLKYLSSKKVAKVFAVSELSPVFMLRKENKQNSDMTWQKHK